MAEGIHEVQEARGAVGVPPAGGQGVEVGYFGWIDGAGGGRGGGVVRARGCGREGS